MGETCEITVKNDNITMIPAEARITVCSNTTLWEVKEEFGRIMDFSPKYIKLEEGKNYSNKTYYTDQDNGKTMKALGIKGGEYFCAKKNLPENNAQPADLANE